MRLADTYCTALQRNYRTKVLWLFFWMSLWSHPFLEVIKWVTRSYDLRHTPDKCVETNLHSSHATLNFRESFNYNKNWRFAPLVQHQLTVLRFSSACKHGKRGKRESTSSNSHSSKVISSSSSSSSVGKKQKEQMLSSLWFHLVTHESLFTRSCIMWMVTHINKKFR